MKRIITLLAAVMLCMMAVPMVASFAGAKPMDENGLRVSTDKQHYEFGESVVITITNTGDDQVYVHPHIDQDGVIANKHTGEVVKMNTPYFTDDVMILKPGQSFTWTWEQTYYIWTRIDGTVVFSRITGMPVPGGVYEISIWDIDTKFVIEQPGASPL